MKDVFKIQSGQLDHDFSTRCIKTAKDFDLKSNVDYEGMTFSWPTNTRHYRVVVEGEPDMIEKFKSYMGVTTEDDSIVVPLIVGAMLILFAIGFAIFH